MAEREIFSRSSMKKGKTLPNKKRVSHFWFTKETITGRKPAFRCPAFFGRRR
jgi:hypothetical protein